MSAVVISEELRDLANKLEAQLSDMTISARDLLSINRESAPAAVTVLLDRIDALASGLCAIALHGEAAAENACGILDGGPAA